MRSDVADGDVRLSMLETVREDAVARLAQEGALDDLRRRHAERFLELAEGAEDALAGPDQATWLERLEWELDNIRATLDWCLSSGHVEDALRAMSALGRFWRAHGHVTEARRWLSLGLDMGQDVAPDARADALWTAARQADAQNDWDATESLLEEALALYREAGREREVALALSHLGSLALHRGDQERAEALCQEALTVARSAGDARAISAGLNILASIYTERGDHEQALASHKEALVLRQTLDDPLLVVDSTYNLAVAAFLGGDFPRARDAFEAARALADELGETLHAVGATLMLAELDLLAGDTSLVADRARECLAVYTRLENDRDRAECLVVLGGVAVAHGDLEEAARLFGAAETLRHGAPVSAYELPVLERFEPELLAALGTDRLAELKAEGARFDDAARRREVVSVGAAGGLQRAETTEEGERRR